MIRLAFCVIASSRTAGVRSIQRKMFLIDCVGFPSWRPTLSHEPARLRGAKIFSSSITFCSFMTI